MAVVAEGVETMLQWAEEVVHLVVVAEVLVRGVDAVGTTAEAGEAVVVEADGEVLTIQVHGNSLQQAGTADGEVVPEVEHGEVEAVVLVITILVVATSKVTVAVQCVDRTNMVHVQLLTKAAEAATVIIPLTTTVILIFFILSTHYSVIYKILLVIKLIAYDFSIFGVMN